MTRLITLLLITLIVTSCSNKNTSSTEEVFKEGITQGDSSVLYADTTAISNHKDKPTSTNSKVTLTDFPLDSLLSFNSESELKKVFGENVKRSIGYLAEGMGEYNNSLLYPNTKNEVEFVWKDDTLNLSGLLFIKIAGKGTHWKTKEGITIGTSLRELEAFNKKPFTFYGFDWDYSGMINWQGGYLERRKISGSLEYPNGEIPNKFKSLIGDQEIKSSSEVAQKANLVLGVIIMRRIE